MLWRNVWSALLFDINLFATDNTMVMILNGSSVSYRVPLPIDSDYDKSRKYLGLQLVGGWKSWARAGTFFFWFRPRLNFLHMLTVTMSSKIFQPRLSFLHMLIMSSRNSKSEVLKPCICTAWAKHRENSTITDHAYITNRLCSEDSSTYA